MRLFWTISRLASIGLVILLATMIATKLFLPGLTTGLRSIAIGTCPLFGQSHAKVLSAASSSPFCSRFR